MHMQDASTGQDKYMVFILVTVNASWPLNINLAGYLRNSGYPLEKSLTPVLNSSNPIELAYEEVHDRTRTPICIDDSDIFQPVRA